MVIITGRNWLNIAKHTEANLDNEAVPPKLDSLIKVQLLIKLSNFWG